MLDPFVHIYNYTISCKDCQTTTESILSPLNDYFLSTLGAPNIYLYANVVPFPSYSMHTFLSFECKPKVELCISFHILNILYILLHYKQPFMGDIQLVTILFNGGCTNFDVFVTFCTLLPRIRPISLVATYILITKSGKLQIYMLI